MNSGEVGVKVASGHWHCYGRIVWDHGACIEAGAARRAGDWRIGEIDPARRIQPQPGTRRAMAGRAAPA
jgi:hypothetical protein